MDKRMLDASGAPLYIQIKNLYRDQILSGELSYGEKIESELEIQKIFSVSRITARQAISDLEKEGLVSRARGKGTFVSYKPEINNSSNPESFTDYIRDQGQVPGTLEFEVTRIQPDDRMARIFEMVSYKPLYCFRRVRTVDNVAICYMVNFFRGDLPLPNKAEAYDESVYQKVIDTLGSRPIKAIEEFSAIIPDEQVRDELHIDADIPVLCKRRRSFDDKGRVLEYSVYFFRGDLYTHKLEADDFGGDK